MVTVLVRKGPGRFVQRESPARAGPRKAALPGMCMGPAGVQQPQKGPSWGDGGAWARKRGAGGEPGHPAAQTAGERTCRRLAELCGLTSAQPASAGWPSLCRGGTREETDNFVLFFSSWQPSDGLDETLPPSGLFPLSKLRTLGLLCPAAFLPHN